MRLDYEISHRLTRSTDGYVGGVCQGLATRFGIDPTLLRILWLAAVVLGFGTGILLYALLWWILPRADQLPVEPTIWKRREDGSHVPPLARTGVDRKLLGVCGGLARRWNLDPSIVRLGALGIAAASMGLAVVAYLVAAIVLPGPASGTDTGAASI